MWHSKVHYFLKSDAYLLDLPEMPQRQVLMALLEAEVVAEAAEVFCPSAFYAVGVVFCYPETVYE